MLKAMFEVKIFYHGFVCLSVLPHMGWNNLKVYNEDSPILYHIGESVDFYFVHSYFFKTKSKL